jgi:hypothetical protein
MSALPVPANTRPIILEVLEGPHAGLVVAVNSFPFRLGRSNENQLVLSNDHKVSREQLELRYSKGQLTLHNISQKTVLLVNGQKMAGAMINATCEFQVGDSKLRLKLLDDNLPMVSVQEGSGLIRRASSLPLSPGSIHQGPLPTESSIPTLNQSQFGGAASPHMTTQNTRQPRYARPKESNRVIFYVFFVGIAVAGLWAYQSQQKSVQNKKKDVIPSVEIEQSIIKSEELIKELQKKRSEAGKDSVQYNLSQQHYLKGFRDFRQGQFSRAISSFEAALSFYSSHELARKYLAQSKLRLDQQISFQMNQGRIAKGKLNYRLCAAHFKSVQNLIRDRSDNRLREAQQLENECLLQQEGKF